MQLSSSKKKALKALFLALVVFGASWRLFTAFHYQSRAWIDEMWVVLCPAYKLLTGAGELKGDWGYEIRSWLPPSLVFVFLKGLDLVGLKEGRVVLAAVRVAVALVTTGALLVFMRAAARQAKLKALPVLPALVIFGVPEFVHYGGLADLSVLGLPPLLLGLAAGPTWAGFIGLALAALIRFQYGVFGAALLIRLLIGRDFPRAWRLVLVGLAALAIEVGYNSLMYGHVVFPLANYFRENTFGGMAASFGTSPFYRSFEILWRFMTEPVFFLAVTTAGIAWRRLPFLAVTSAAFFAIHALIGHKEYRFFYGPAVLLATVAATALQAWVEDAGASRLKVAALWAVAFIAAASWRAETRTRWADYQIPSKLETLAGERPDARGLLSIGWGGVYSGCHYTFYRKLPYVSVARREDLTALDLAEIDYNYVVVPASWRPPCSDLVASDGGGALYRCLEGEVRGLISSVASSPK